MGDDPIGTTGNPSIVDSRLPVVALVVVILIGPFGPASDLAAERWLMIGALTFGALLEELGRLDRLIDPLIHAAGHAGPLFLSHLHASGSATR
jgi:hypothetical protein